MLADRPCMGTLTFIHVHQGFPSGFENNQGPPDVEIRGPKVRCRGSLF